MTRKRKPASRRGGTRCMFCGERAAFRCKTGDCRHCEACEKSWIPCHPTCPGFHLNLDGDSLIEICDECVISAHPSSRTATPNGERLTDADARGWPEAYLAAAKLLTRIETETRP